eukprot:TRINITY_DN5512_c0_g1_i1.p1 TRINITY_DN5512_c0_g1~~TRINITY_DN5512_c0_g1_i1.p1  ORF type:complete len:242 (-),score=68.69 TRINITY_DN5512_c0_g1_i1:182-859(-)
MHSRSHSYPYNIWNENQQQHLKTDINENTQSENIKSKFSGSESELPSQVNIRNANVDIYGFVGWMSSIVGLVLFLLWAYLPDSILHQLGIFYYPNKYWAIAMPCYLCVTIIFIVLAYGAINLIITEPLDSIYTLKDNYSKSLIHSNFKSDSIPPIMDMPITEVNYYLYPNVNSKKVKQKVLGHKRAQSWHPAQHFGVILLLLILIDCSAFIKLLLIHSLTLTPNP